MNRLATYFHRNTVKRLRRELQDSLTMHAQGREEAYVFKQRHQANVIFYDEKERWLASVVERLQQQLDNISDPSTTKDLSP